MKMVQYAAVVLLVGVFPTVVRGDIIATGGLGTKTDWSNFVNRRGAGGNCVNVVAVFITNPGTGAPCQFEVPIPRPLFSFRPSTMTVDGKGNTAFKVAPSTTSTYTDMATAAGHTSLGTATWTYMFDVGPLDVDTGSYAATSRITPTPAAAIAANYRADAKAFDPVFFDATASGVMGFEATLPELSLTVDGAQGLTYAGARADYSFDGVMLFDFRLIALAGFTGVDDLEISYTSILGPAFDNAMTSAILANLNVDPASGTVTLRTSMTLFPRTEFLFGPGEHELSGGFATTAASVPEPSTLALLGIGTLGLLGYGWRRQKRGCRKELVP